MKLIAAIFTLHYLAPCCPSALSSEEIQVNQREFIQGIKIGHPVLYNVLYLIGNGTKRSIPLDLRFEIRYI